MDSGSRGPDPYRLLTPRRLLLSFVLRLHWGAVVEKLAAARIVVVAGNIEVWRRDWPSRDAQPDEARSALGAAAAVTGIVTKCFSGD
jgi:hypothetical protein